MLNVASFIYEAFRLDRSLSIEHYKVWTNPHTVCISNFFRANGNHFQIAQRPITEQARILDAAAQQHEKIDGAAELIAEFSQVG